MKCSPATIIPKLLNFEQKQHRVDIVQKMLMTFNDDPDLLKKVITCDESLLRKAMTLKPKPNQPNGSVQKSQDRKKHIKFGQCVKVLLTIFFDCSGVVHHEFFPQGRTNKKKCCIEVMCRLREVIR